jgi:hypothetical protein
MKQARFLEERIIAELKEHEAGAKTADLLASIGFPRQRSTIGRPNLAVCQATEGLGRGELRGRLRDLANERRRFGSAGCSSCRGGKGEPSGINRIYRLCRQEATGSAQGCGDPGPAPGGGQARRALVPGVCPRPVRQRPALPAISTLSTTTPKNAWAPFRRRRSRGGGWPANSRSSNDVAKNFTLYYLMTLN